MGGAVMDEILILKETLFHLQICTTIVPDNKQEINQKIGAYAIAGTSRGWQLDETVEPVKCDDYEDRWHYIMDC
jgi:hypothetical protein